MFMNARRPLAAVIAAVAAAVVALRVAQAVVPPAAAEAAVRCAAPVEVMPPQPREIAGSRGPAPTLRPFALLFWRG